MHTSRNQLSFMLRLLILTLAMIMALGSVACTKSDPNTADPTDTTASDTKTEASTEDETEAETTAEAETEDETEAETTAEAETEPSGVTYTVTAVDENGYPISGVTVQLCKGDVCLLPQATDENGTVSFVRDQPDDYTVKAFKDGYTSQEKYYFEAGSTTVTVVLEEILAPAATQFTVSNVFSNDMVLQRDELVRIWGWADESQNGMRVSAEFLGTVAHAVIENGEWIITFKETWDANTNMGNTLTVYGEDVSYNFENVLVGDVYMAIGQSNIAYAMSTHLANTPESHHGNLDENALIRLHFNSQNQTQGVLTWGTTDVCREIYSSSRWALPTEQNYSGFSAPGYYFAHNMLIANGNTVPIGIIEVEAAGKQLSCFLSNEVADAINADPNLSDADTFNTGKKIYESSGVNGIGPTRFVYNQLIYPFEKYAIAGMIWYQGESDLHDANTHTFAEKFIPLMEYMRSTHNVLNKEYPLYIMEFPTCYNPDWKFGGVRAVLGQVATHYLSNCYVSASSDMLPAAVNDVLHPDIKWEQAQRLSAIAAYVEYGQGNLDEAMGPILVSMELSADKKTAVLTYTNVGEGLKTIDGSESVLGFTQYRSHYFAMGLTLTARITAPNQVTVTSNRKIEGVGYNTAVGNFFGVGRDLNLCNSYGIPAIATFIFPEE